jgi:hypothetical protein
MTLGPYESEVELAPGIYLTKKKPTEEEVAKEQLQKTLQQLEGDPKAHLEFLKDQILRTEKAIDQLQYSNKAMHDADPTDPVFVEVDGADLGHCGKHHHH